MTRSRTSSYVQMKDMASRCLCFRTRRTARLITRDYDAALAPTGLKATQLTLLCAIELRDDLGMTDLAELLGLEQSTLSRNVAVLRSRGLLRVATAKDRRQRELSLTAKGRKLVDEAYPLWERAQQAAAERYLSGDRAAVLSAFDAQVGLAPRRS